MRVAAWIVFLAGTAGLIYGLAMDTTVAVPGHLDDNGQVHRVHNLGRMSDRQSILIASGLGMLIGVVAEIGVSLKRKEPDLQPPRSVDPLADPDDWQNQHVEISQQHAEWAAKAGRGLLLLLCCTVAIARGQGLDVIEPTNPAKLDTHKSTKQPPASPDELVARAKAELDAARKGVILPQMKTKERRINHGTKPPDWKFKDSFAKMERTNALNVAYLAAMEAAHPKPPTLEPERLSSGASGHLRWQFVLVRKITGKREALICFQAMDIRRKTAGAYIDLVDVLLKNFDTANLAEGQRFEIDGEFRVSEDRTGGRKIFVIEPDK